MSTASSPPASEHLLVEQARRGCHGAFAKLVEQHLAVARGTAYAIAGANDAEDVAQIAFLKAFSGLHHFRRGAPFRPWLLTIVANEARDARRSCQRQHAIAARVTAAAGQQRSEPGIDRRTLLAAISRLPSVHRDPVVCRYLLDYSEAETANALGVPAGTVKSRLSRALDRLREELARQGVWRLELTMAGHADHGKH